MLMSGAAASSTFIVPRRNARSTVHDKALPVCLTLEILAELSVLPLVQASQVLMLMCWKRIRKIQAAKSGKLDASDHEIHVKTNAKPVFR